MGERPAPDLPVPEGPAGPPPPEPTPAAEGARPGAPGGPVSPRAPATGVTPGGGAPAPGTDPGVPGGHAPPGGAVAGAGRAGTTPSPAAPSPSRGSAAPALAEQVAARLATLEGEQGSVTVRLDPPELGEVILRFVRRGERLHVHVRAERPDVAALLGQESARIELACARQGTHVQVDVAAGDSRGQGDPSRGTAGRREPGGGSGPTRDVVAGPGGAPGEVGRERRPGVGLLDVVG